MFETETSEKEKGKIGYNNKKIFEKLRELSKKKKVYLISFPEARDTGDFGIHPLSTFDIDSIQLDKII